MAERMKGAVPEETTSSRRSGYTLADELVEQALVTGEHRDLLEPYFGEDLYQELRGLTARARTARTRGGPRVLILPGIMGSKLGHKRKPNGIFDDILWVDPLDILAGRLRDLSIVDGDARVKALGVMLFCYLRLKLHLNINGFDVSFYPFDWRRDIAKLGADLARWIEHEMPTEGRQLSIVAHSMGGLVARAAIRILDRRKADREEKARKRGAAQEEVDKVRRLIMLGTPNHGSFSPVQALSGNHPLVRKLGALDLTHSEAQLVNDVFNTFLGLYQMLPARAAYPGIDLYDLDNWPHAVMGPRQELLKEAPALHRRLAAGGPRFVLIAGVDRATTVGVRREENEFVFSQSLEGDGTVPLAFAELEDVCTYYVQESHGSLPANGRVSEAVVDLLETGRTDVLPTSWTPKQRGETWDVRAAEIADAPFDGRAGDRISFREQRHLLDEFVAPAERPREETAPPTLGPPTTISQEPIVVGRRRQQRIDIQLAHGSITQVDTRAVVLGLFRSVSPSGAARAIDKELDGVITEFTERRILSAGVGEVFIMPTSRYRVSADMVVFAGLGAYDDFNDEVLRLVAENVARALVRTKVDDFATVLLGTGSGVPIADVLRNLIAGFIRGLAEGDEQGHLHSITLCESDRTRFEQVHQDLLRLTTTSLFDGVEATVSVCDLPPLPPPPAAPRRMRVEIPVLDPVYLIVRQEGDRIAAGDEGPANGAGLSLRASVLTAGSRATVITDVANVNREALDKLLGKIGQRKLTFSDLPDFGADLAKLVLTDLVRKALGGTKDRELVVIHDAVAAGIPWETIAIDEWFPAAQAGVSRKYEAEAMAVAKWLESRRLADELRVLLIVDPLGDLGGARTEGERVRAILEQDPLIQLDELWQAEASFSAVRAAFHSGAYDVVHYAGHAFFDPVDRARSGIRCHGNVVLSGRELASLEKLPAVVFFNACESGRVRGEDTEPLADADRVDDLQRLEMSVGLAEALLRAGVGNYIGTYWPVGDEAAKTFGETFYGAVVRGDTVGKALQDARKKLLDGKSRDWPDYMHYGSPSFRVKRRIESSPP